jgi:hypothetical protein
VDWCKTVANGSRSFKACMYDWSQKSDKCNNDRIIRQINIDLRDYAHIGGKAKEK